MSLPADWLPSGRSVISYFLPLSERVRESNRGDGPASPEWLHTRLEGRMFVLRLGEHLERLVRDAGFEAICPACHPNVEAARMGGDYARPSHGAWSEKRAAYVCGLGTFSLSNNVITRKGVAGLFGSIIVSAELPATERDYEGIDDYCIKCGACANRCPAGAISAESGRNGKTCHAQRTKPQLLYPGYHGCGKCQVDVPCEFARPERA